MMNDVKDHVFHNAATATGKGQALSVEYFKDLTIDIDGTDDNTARTVTFYGIGPSGNARILKGMKSSDWSSGTSTTGKGETWTFDITGLKQVYMELTAITGGSISISGRAVS